MNERLTALMTDAGFLDREGTIGRKRFARAVSAMALARGVDRTYSHTYVSRWLRGVVPRDVATREAIRDALAQQLGRPIEPDELGFRTADTTALDVGLAYPDQPEDGVVAVAQLLDADLAGKQSIGQTPANVAAWNDASLAWLVGAQRPLSDAVGPTKVGDSDVERLRGMRQSFDRLDSMYGGGHARSALVQYLRTEIPRLLRSGGRSDIRRALFVAAGEATQLAAWMSYDAGLHGLAQRYFIQALGFADAGDDRLLAASILDAMSHQASFLGRYREAVNMARAARLGTEAIGVPILTSHFYVMEARALARIGDATECDHALAAAAREFDRHNGGDAPEWILYFDEAEIAAELAHCHRDLGRADRAVAYATQALDNASGNYRRSDFFVAMVLADAHLDRGEIEEGCRVASVAFGVGEGLESARCRSYVEEFKHRLVRHKQNRAVREFVVYARDNRLWTPTSTGQ